MVLRSSLTATAVCLHLKNTLVIAAERRNRYRTSPHQPGAPPGERGRLHPKGTITYVETSEIYMAERAESRRDNVSIPRVAGRAQVQSAPRPAPGGNKTQ